MKEYCLFNYTSLYYKQISNHGIPFQHHYPQHCRTTQFHRTNSPRIPNLLGCLTYLNPNSTDAGEREKYFCILTVLFTSWTKDTIGKMEDMTWEQYFDQRKGIISDSRIQHIANINLLYKLKESHFDRLQRKSTGGCPHFLCEESLAGDSEINEADEQQVLSDSQMLGSSEEDWIVQLVAQRDTPVTDFYILEAIDACFDYDYFVEYNF